MLIKQGSRTDYNYKEYVLDTKDDLANINTGECCPGSVAYIIDSKELYMLNSKKEWVLQ
ncbi:MAG: hypothetical protein PUJ51_20515 [Clostridiales bacterium]|nr:hypothetical protein [Clostridiales bacterium]